MPLAQGRTGVFPQNLRPRRGSELVVVQRPDVGVLADFTAGVQTGGSLFQGFAIMNAALLARLVVAFAFGALAATALRAIEDGFRWSVYAFAAVVCGAYAFRWMLTVAVRQRSVDRDPEPRDGTGMRRSVALMLLAPIPGVMGAALLYWFDSGLGWDSYLIAGGLSALVGYEAILEHVAARRLVDGI